MFLLILLAGISSAAMAANFTVTKAADTNDGVCDTDCSLREAILAANATSTDDVINFDAGTFGVPQTITLGGTELNVASGKHLTINGPGSNLLTISGNDQSRVLFVSENAVVTINGLRITGENSAASAGTADGGGLATDPKSTVTMNDLGIVGKRTADSAVLVSVSGIVTSPDGRGIRNATVSISDSLGATQTTETGAFGGYQFSVVPGGTYTISVLSKRYRFLSQTMTINSDLTDVNFSGDE